MNCFIDKQISLTTFVLLFTIKKVGHMQFVWNNEKGAEIHHYI